MITDIAKARPICTAAADCDDEGDPPYETFLSLCHPTWCLIALDEIERLRSHTDGDRLDRYITAAEFQAIGNLLAVIHGDGGHYQGEHGIEKACADAEARIVRERTDLDAAKFLAANLETENEQANNETRAALEQLAPLQAACALVVEAFEFSDDCDFGHHPTDDEHGWAVDCPEDDTCVCPGIKAINACATAIGYGK